MKDYNCEWGSNYHVRFTDISMVKLYDGEGNQIEIPKCVKCNNYKAHVVGEKVCVWICTNGCEG